MTDTKHTPGPWIDYEFCGDWFVSNSTDNSGPMLQVGSWCADREANARLIAAAPDMLKTLKRLEYWFDIGDVELAAMTPDVRADHVRQHQMIRAVIANAEGQAND